MTKLSILLPALEGRDQELLTYQINIDNYRLAIAKINADHADNDDLLAFRDDLQSRLDEELRQQARARIIRDVIAEQVADAELQATEAP
jgi:FKBP-type peptidyl-prolyl cis-trans isomerase (trigger factor)